MAESETRESDSDDATTSGWPSAPNVRELPLALMLSVIFAAAIIFLRPVFFARWRPLTGPLAPFRYLS